MTTEWEYRNVGEHDWYDGGGIWPHCRRCPARRWPATGIHRRPVRPCPSKRERRRVGPWEPTPEPDR